MSRIPTLLWILRATKSALLYVKFPWDVLMEIYHLMKTKSCSYSRNPNIQKLTLINNLASCKKVSNLHYSKTLVKNCCCVSGNYFFTLKTQLRAKPWVYCYNQIRLFRFFSQLPTNTRVKSPFRQSSGVVYLNLLIWCDNSSTLNDFWNYFSMVFRKKKHLKPRPITSTGFNKLSK